MSLQNRVTPFGEIVAIPQRGLFTGNRGIIHDPSTKTLLKRRWSTKAWIICSCQYKDRRRLVMAGRSWTELFFLDEAVALSAGHRPCFTCRREAAEQFRNAWVAGHGGSRVSVGVIDGVLHQERLAGTRKRIHSIPGALTELPDGAIVVAGGAAFTLCAGLAYQWAVEGYAAPVRLAAADGLLTPPSTVLALRAGYRPVFHSSLTDNASS